MNLKYTSSLNFMKVTPQETNSKSSTPKIPETRRIPSLSMGSFNNPIQKRFINRSQENSESIGELSITSAPRVSHPPKLLSLIGIGKKNQAKLVGQLQLKRSPTKDRLILNKKIDGGSLLIPYVNSIHSIQNGCDMKNKDNNLIDHSQYNLTSRLENKEIFHASSRYFSDIQKFKQINNHVMARNLDESVSQQENQIESLTLPLNKESKNGKFKADPFPDVSLDILGTENSVLTNNKKRDDMMKEKTKIESVESNLLALLNARNPNSVTSGHVNSTEFNLLGLMRRRPKKRLAINLKAFSNSQTNTGKIISEIKPKPVLRKGQTPFQAFNEEYTNIFQPSVPNRKEVDINGRNSQRPRGILSPPQKTGSPNQSPKKVTFSLNNFVMVYEKQTPELNDTPLKLGMNETSNQILRRQISRRLIQKKTNKNILN